MRGKRAQTGQNAALRRMGRSVPEKKKTSLQGKEKPDTTIRQTRRSTRLAWMQVRRRTAGTSLRHAHEKHGGLQRRVLAILLHTKKTNQKETCKRRQHGKRRRATSHYVGRDGDAARLKKKHTHTHTTFIKQKEIN